MPLRAALRAALILACNLVKLLTQLLVGYYVMLLCVLVVVSMVSSPRRQVTHFYSFACCCSCAPCAWRFAHRRICFVMNSFACGFRWKCLHDRNPTAQQVSTFSIIAIATSGRASRGLDSDQRLSEVTYTALGWILRYLALCSRGGSMVSIPRHHVT